MGSGPDKTRPHLRRHYLFFQAVTSQVFSARVSLTAVFGMGTGGPSPQSAPTSILTTLAVKTIPIQLNNGDPWESRTPVCGVRGRRLDHLTNGPFCVASLGVSLLGASHPRGSGTPSGTRTLDTLIKSQVLYQLS